MGSEMCIRDRVKATSSSDTDSKSRFMQRLESMAEYAESRVDLDDDSENS